MYEIIFVNDRLQSRIAQNNRANARDPWWRKNRHRQDCAYGIKHSFTVYRPWSETDSKV